LLFAKFIKKHHPAQAEDFKMYTHTFPSGLEVEARQYENSLLPLFIKFVDDIWIPKHSEKYFSKRDKVALDYLPKLIK
jgi:hypothetical protein